MANQKITQLAALVTPTSDDLVPVVDDPGGVPVTKKVTLDNFTAALSALAITKGLLVSPDGWIAANESWTYNSVSGINGVINVPAGATNKYARGDRVRFKQGGGYKYFSVIAVAATTLTITGGTDYTLVNAGITDNYYSKSELPVGFPNYFNYTPTLTWTAGVNPAGAPTVLNRFKISGSWVVLNVFQYGFTAGTGVTQVQVSLPVASTGNQSGTFGYLQNSNTPNLSYCQCAASVAYVWCTSVNAERFQVAGCYMY